MYSLATFLGFYSLSLGAKLGVSEYSAFFAQINKKFKTWAANSWKAIFIVYGSLGLRE